MSSVASASDGITLAPTPAFIIVGTSTSVRSPTSNPRYPRAATPATTTDANDPRIPIPSSRSRTRTRAPAPTPAPSATLDSDTDDALPAAAAAAAPPPAAAASVKAEPAERPSTPTEDEIDALEAEEIHTLSEIDRARKRVAIKTRLHSDIRTRLAAARKLFAQRQRQQREARVRQLVEEKRLMGRQLSDGQE